MPLCPQITNTPITVTQTADFTVSSVVPAVADTADGLVGNFDAKTEVFYQATAPTGASRGDLWFDTDDGNKQYYYDGTNWIIVEDADIAAALAAANQALSDAATALSEANSAYSLASTSIQTSANTIVNSSNQLTAINGNGITVYAGASASSGARVLLNSSGIVGYNSSNSPTFTLDASNGNVSITGASFTSGTISGGSLNIAGNCIINTSGFLTATGATITGAITATSGSFTGTITSAAGSIGGWAITSTALTKTVGTKTMTLDSANAILSISDSTNNILSGGAISVSTPSVTTLYSAGGVGIGSVLAIDANSDLGGYNGIPRIYAPANKYIRIVPNAGLNSNTYPVYIEGPIDITGRIQCYGNVNIPNIPSTTSAANVRWTTGGVGQLQYVTSSSQRYKENITNLLDVSELDPKKLLDLPVRAFTYKEDYLGDSDDRFATLVPGFIAEEVDSIYPIAADYDNDGPINWNDRFLIPGMLALIQDLYKEIQQLKGE